MILLEQTRNPSIRKHDDPCPCSSLPGRKVDMPPSQKGAPSSSASWDKDRHSCRQKRKHYLPSQPLNIKERKNTKVVCSWGNVHDRLFVWCELTLTCFLKSSLRRHALFVECFLLPYIVLWTFYHNDWQERKEDLTLHWWVFTFYAFKKVRTKYIHCLKRWSDDVLVQKNALCVKHIRHVQH